ncbi:MAG: hypothetical protein AB3N11_15715 [Arenibacterium sp.]
MLVIGGGAIGAVLGIMAARKNGGNRLDMAQYAVAGGIALALLGMIATIMIHRAAI